MLAIGALTCRSKNHGRHVKQYALKRKSATTTTTEIDWDGVLNPQQKAVVQAGSGPLLVIAGAGTGKTHTLTHRVAWLLHKGVPADSILLLTFTNRAAREMVGRVAELVEQDVHRALWGGTFHHVGLRLLRKHANRLGYPDRFTVLDPEDSSILMKYCVHETGIDVTRQRFPRSATLRDVLGYCINTQRTVEEVLEERAEEFLDLAEEIRDVFQTYQAKKLEVGALDFDDLILGWKRLMVECEDVRTEVAGRFEHVLVDEYQDTNALQGELVDLVASFHRNLMVVGDDCQSIYAFRGAEYRNILEFEQRYPDAQQFRLETNYRSTPEIIELTNRSIAKNENQFHKTLVADRTSGERPALLRIRDVYQQADFVCQRILDLADEGYSLNDVAVLYRAHHHAAELQVEMARYGIPFVVRSGVRFFEQAHIKDVLAYLRFVFNPRDELAFLRVAQHYRGVGAARARDLWQAVRGAQDPLRAATDPQLASLLPERAARNWKHCAGLLSRLADQRLTATPRVMVESVVTGPYEEYLEANFENHENRLGDIEQLAHYAEQYGDLDRFLGEVTLLSAPAGQDIVVGGEKPDEYVTLSSSHQAKGLEWRACFLLWLSDGQFPSANAAEENLEEERRLFYVASTRARDELYLCHVFKHERRGRGSVVLRESQFIEELRRSTPEQEPFESWSLVVE